MDFGTIHAVPANGVPSGTSQMYLRTPPDGFLIVVRKSMRAAGLRASAPRGHQGQNARGTPRRQAHLRDVP